MKKIRLLGVLFLFLAILSSINIVLKNQDYRKKAAGSTVNIPKRLAIFHGYVTELQGSFSNFDVIVMPNGGQDSEDADYTKIKNTIPGLLSVGKEVFGYLDLGLTSQKLTSVEAQAIVEGWRVMGVTGIMLDNAGYDFGVTRTRQKELVDYIHGRGLKVMIESTEPDDVFASLPALTFNVGDYYLSEDWLVGGDKYQNIVAWGLKADKLVKYGNQTNVRIAVVSTATTTKNINDCWWGAAMVNAYAFGFAYPNYSATEIGADTLMTVPVVSTNFGTQFVDTAIIHSPDYRTHTRRTDKGIITISGDGVTSLLGSFSLMAVPTNTPIPTTKPVLPTATLVPTNPPVGGPTKIIVVPTTPVITSTTNIIPNNSVETVSSNAGLPSSFDTDNWGSNSATFSYLTSGARSGGRALKVQISSISDGDAKWTFNSLTVTPGLVYKFSDWYQSNIASRIVAYYVISDGTENYVELTSAPASSVWSQYMTTFTVPANAKTLSVFHLIDKVGWLTTDDYSLSTGTGSVVVPTATLIPTKVPVGGPTSIPTKVPTATLIPTKVPVVPTVIPASGGTNFIYNNSVEKAATYNANLPESWGKDRWGTNTSVFTYLSSGAYSGSRALKVETTSYRSGDAKWSFNVLPVVPGEVYTFSDMYMSNVVSPVVIMYINNDGSETYIDLADAPPAASYTKYQSSSFTIPANANSMTVFHLINKIGWLTTDDYSLIRK